MAKMKRAVVPGYSNKVVGRGVLFRDISFREQNRIEYLNYCKIKVMVLVSISSPIF